MSGKMAIRPAVEADATVVQQIARDAWHAAYSDVLDADTIDETVAEWYAPDRLVADDITASDRPFFVAETENTVVGFVEAVPAEAGDGVAPLYRIYVDPDYWQQGVGRMLLERVEDELRDRGFTRLRLSVFAENAVGVRFYEAMGFERVDSSDSDRFDAREYTYIKEL